MSWTPAKITQRGNRLKGSLYWCIGAAWVEGMPTQLHSIPFVRITLRMSTKLLNPERWNEISWLTLDRTNQIYPKTFLPVTTVSPCSLQSTFFPVKKRERPQSPLIRSARKWREDREPAIEQIGVNLLNARVLGIWGGPDRFFPVRWSPG